jgi:uncharacterized protein (TIGR01319 family)
MSFLDFLREDKTAESIPAEPTEETGAILAIDVGTVYTRAILLDTVDGIYRFVARAEAPTTADAPWNNIMEGVLRVLHDLSAATGRQLLNERDELIMPERDDFYGVSKFVATSSAGKPIKAVLVGLVPDVSLSSGKRAADSTYLKLTDTFSLADSRTEDQRIDALLTAKPDLILIVGGTDGGAVHSMRRQINTIALACSLMEEFSRPTVLYAGNRDLREEVTEKLREEAGVRLLLADNVRPELNTERLDSAQSQLASLYHTQKSNNTPGFAQLGGWTDEGIYPTAHGFSRMVRLLGGLENRDVLGFDVGSNATTVAASIKGSHYLNVFGQLGIGHSAKELLNQIRPENLTRWLTYEPKSTDEVIDYVWNKWLFPYTVPTTERELEIEYAMAREVVRNAVLNARQGWREVRQRGLLPPFETILLSGMTLSHTPHYGWSALIALDALMPVGVTRLLLDLYGMAAALGAIAPISPRAVVQTLDTGAFIDLGTVLSISGRARQGEIVLRGMLRLEDSATGEPFEIRYGTLARLPLSYGTRAELTLHPRRSEIEVAGGRIPRRLTVTGGELGLIVDARGRPWRFPRNPEQRREMLRKWQQALIEEGQP